MPAKTHGHVRGAPLERKLYSTWQHVKSRCLNPNVDCYRNYGGRGIRMCSAWVDSYEQFAKDVGLPPSLSITLDRIDNDGHYEPSNVRWATRSEQNRNKRQLPRKAFKVGPVEHRIRKLLAEGRTTREVAALVGVGKTAVWKVSKT